MRIPSLISVLCLALGANSLVAFKDKDKSGNLEAAIAVLRSLTQAFVNLGDAADSFNGDFNPIKEAGANLMATVDKDLEILYYMDNLTMPNCAHLVKHGHALKKQSEILLKQYKAAKPALEKETDCAPTWSIFDQATNGSARIIDSMSKKTPEPAQEMVKSHGGKVTDALIDIREEYGPENCKN